MRKTSRESGQGLVRALIAFVLCVVGALAYLIWTGPTVDNESSEDSRSESTAGRPPEATTDRATELNPDPVQSLPDHDGKTRRYRTTVLRRNALSKRYRDGLLQRLRELRSKFPSVTIHRVKGPCANNLRRCSKVEDTRLDWKELALVTPMLESGSKGDEWDLVIRTGEGEAPLYGTVWWEPDGALFVSSPMARARKSVREKSAASLEAQYHLGSIRSSDAPWTGAELGLVASGFSRLDEREAAMLSGVHLKRAKKSTDRKAGLYSYEGASETITMFDAAFSGDSDAFIGNPSAPLPSSFTSLLHEVGHLVANQPFVVAIQTLEDTIDRYNALVEQHNRAAAAGQFETTERLAKKIEQASRSVERAEKRKSDAEDVVINAFEAVRSVESGPTEYGETSLSEAFAESFALYRLDRPALERIDPFVVDWFDNGGHLDFSEGSHSQTP